MKHFARYLLPAVLLIPLGCSGLQKGVGVLSYDKGTQPILAKATADGEYSLYATQNSEPRVSYYLHQGDALGFKYGKTGEIVGVGGESEVTVPDGNYIWKRRDAMASTAPAK